jgi:hypothetical protein
MLLLQPCEGGRRKPHLGVAAAKQTGRGGREPECPGTGTGSKDGRKARV